MSLLSIHYTFIPAECNTQLIKMETKINIDFVLLYNRHVVF